jgi:RNA polymerase sigma-70 factor (ECF subfamily)
MPEKTEQGFLEIVRRHERLIGKLVRVYAVSPEDRKDLFQEILYQLWRSYGSFRGESSWTTWIYRVALNTAITSFRRVQKHPEHAQLEEEIPVESQSHENLELHERTQLVYRAIRSFNKVDRAVITLYLEDLSYREIAEVLGISEDNVGVRLNRIKEKLRSFFGVLE